MYIRSRRIFNKQKRYTKDIYIICSLIALLFITITGDITGKFDAVPTPKPVPHVVAKEASKKERMMHEKEVIATSDGPIVVIDGPPMDNDYMVTTYTVEAGDNLWSIAEQLTGNGANWTKLWEANQSLLTKGDSRNLEKAGWYIHPGQIITISSLQ